LEVASPVATATNRGEKLPPEAEFLPSEDQQVWLLAALEELLQLRGSRHFLSMPLVEPTAKYFPDRWSFTEAGLDRVVRRLMQYAELGHLDVRITTFADPGAPVGRKHSAHRATAGVFLGIQDGCCYFGFNSEALADEEYVAGVMAHEVAHAYRDHHALCDTSDQEREECLTDVTAAYLGFGILVANNSYRYRASHTGSMLGGGLFAHSESQVGYLSPQAFSFLLAIQMKARGLEGRRRSHVLRHLETTQQAFAKAAAEAILEWPEETLERLRIALGDATVEEIPLKSILLPLPPLPEVPEEATPDEDPAVNAPLFNQGYPVFRVGQSKTTQYGTVGVLAGVLLWAAAVAAPSLAWLFITSSVIGTAAGIIAGVRARYDICSDPECTCVLPPDATLCPNCGGFVAGSIRSASDRLAAEEEYEAAHQSRRRKKSKPRRAKPPRS